jgi:hypothetical protein
MICRPLVGILSAVQADHNEPSYPAAGGSRMLRKINTPQLPHSHFTPFMPSEFSQHGSFVEGG